MIVEEYEPVVLEDRQVNIVGKDDPVEVENDYFEEYVVTDSYEEDDIRESDYVFPATEEVVENEIFEPVFTASELPSEDNILSSSDDNYKIIVVSANNVEHVTLDDEQYDRLVDLIEQDNVVSVSADFVTSNEFRDFTTNIYLIGILIFGILFGYFVKETIFRGF